MIKHIDTRRTCIILSKDMIIPYLVDMFYLDLEAAIKAKGKFHVGLAGGSTPKKLYEAICQDARAGDTDFSKVYVYYGDERVCPLDHTDSNYHMSLEAGFKNLKGLHIFPMPAYKNDPGEASTYEALLPTHLDLIFLGMGDDGHTASLFPSDPLCQVVNTHVAFGYIESKKASRMTLTFPYINLSSKIIVLVTGESKKEKIKQVLSEEGQIYPAYHIGTKQHPAFFVLDHAASSLI